VVSSTNKTDHQTRTEVLLKMALNKTTLTHNMLFIFINIRFVGLSVLSDNFADTEVQVLDVFMNIFFIFKDHEDIIYKDK
jgi:hypothetical protein